MSVEVNIISSGSNGNSVLYQKKVMVDCGLAYKYVKSQLTTDLSCLLYSHRHSDHFREATYKHLVNDFPNLVILCGSFMKELIEGLETDSRANVVYCEPNKWYRVGDIEVSPFILYHDCPNYGWRIKVDGKKIFHATDTFTLDNIIARDYDLYVLEGNFDEDTIKKEIDESIEKGEFTYKIGAQNSHLSFQRAYRFYYLNKKDDSELRIMHKSRQYEEEDIYEKYIKGKLNLVEGS